MGFNASACVEDLLTPLRFNEWGRAVLQKQLDHLKTTAGHEYFFTAYYGPHEAAGCSDLRSDIAGTLMSAGAPMGVSIVFFESV